jgi:hypothetical protein
MLGVIRVRVVFGTVKGCVCYCAICRIGHSRHLCKERHDITLVSVFMRSIPFFFIEVVCVGSQLSAKCEVMYADRVKIR